ncbi:MAG: PEP-CTERM sorting domain-containing protein [Planctomycetota bacterium]
MMYNKKLRLADGRSRKLMSVMAAAGAAASVGQNAEALEFLNSGAITTNNIVGWVNGSETGTNQVASYKLNLNGAGEGASFNLKTATKFFAVTAKRNAAVPYFKIGTYIRPAGGSNPLSSAAKTFAANATWGNAGVAINEYAYLAAANMAKYYVYGKINPAKTNKYLLFRFKDTGNVNTYNGWINVDFTNYFNYSSFDGIKFAFLNGWVKINSYAWQNVTTGILGAGQTAVGVPEPSTLITSGIAALTGGALALRRWRKERKTAPAVA